MTQSGKRILTLGDRVDHRDHFLFGKATRRGRLTLSWDYCRQHIHLIDRRCLHSLLCLNKSVSIISALTRVTGSEKVLLEAATLPHSPSVTSFKVLITSLIEKGSSAHLSVVPGSGADFLIPSAKCILKILHESALKAFRKRSTRPLLVMSSGFTLSTSLISILKFQMNSRTLS